MSAAESARTILFREPCVHAGALGWSEPPFDRSAARIRHRMEAG